MQPPGTLPATMSPSVSEGTSLSVMGCVECESKFCSANQLCRHMSVTKHGLVKCPECDTYIVARALFAGLKKLLGRGAKERTQQQGKGRLAGEGSSVDLHAPPKAASLAAFNVDTSSHAHLGRYPGLRLWEKLDFLLTGKPEDYGLLPIVKTDVLSLRTAAAESVRTGARAGSTESPSSAKSFRCMDCLNLLPTWTKVAKHIDSTEHTLPTCLHCGKCLKCYGPLRPFRHEEETGHYGFFGLYNVRADYALEKQKRCQQYDASTRYTGLTLPQYQCVCSLSFLSVAHLAMHLRWAHGVPCISDHATCHTCGVTLDLEDMLRHLRTLPSRAPAPDAPVLPDTGAMDAGISPHTEGHEVTIEGFDAAIFLRYRPLLASHREETEGAPLSTDPNYVVWFQCQECFLLFHAWDKVLRHLEATGHCRSYCVPCGTYLPHLQGYMQRGPPPATVGPSPSAVRAPVPCRQDFVSHLLHHSNVIGSPASPETLEVLVDIHDEAYGGLDDLGIVPSGAGASGGVESPGGPFLSKDLVTVFQCPDEDDCCDVFLYYGHLVEHLLATGHGRRPGSVELIVAVPIVECRVLFTVSQLCTCFGFQLCAYCRRPFPPSCLELHKFLCVEYHKQLGRDAEADRHPKSVAHTK